MGSAASRSKKTKAARAIPATMDEDKMEVFSLLKDSPGCTGMFWRGDPSGGGRAPSDNWPRDGAKLKGIVHDVKGAKWLEVAEVQQAGSKWVAAPAGAWMPFRHQQYYLEASS